MDRRPCGSPLLPRRISTKSTPRPARYSPTRSRPAGSSRRSKYYYVPSDDNGLAVIVVEPTTNLLELQQKLIDAVTSFTVRTGTTAYVTTPAAPDINQWTLDYIPSFVPTGTGKNFAPHVSIGLASQEYLKPMVAQPFEVFTFLPAGVSVYQLGNLEPARKSNSRRLSSSPEAPTTSREGDRGPSHPSASNSLTRGARSATIGPRSAAELAAPMSRRADRRKPRDQPAAPAVARAVRL